MINLSRRGLFGLAAGAGLAAGLSACTSSAAGSPSAAAAAAKVTVGLTYIPNIQFAPFYVADTAGLFEAQGIAATLRHHGETEGLFTALAAGQEDVVVAGADEMLQARSQGLDLVTIAQYYRQYPVVAIVPESSPITSAAELKGHTIGVPGKYGETWFGLKVLLKGAGLAESDVKISEIGYTQQAALTGKKVDAIMGYANNDVVNFAAAGVAVRTIPLVTTGTVPLISVSLVTTRTYLDAHADVAGKVVAATVEGFRKAAAGQPAALTASEKYIVTLAGDATAQAAAAKTLAASVPLWKDASGSITGTIESDQFTAMGAFMLEQGLIPAAADPGAMRNL